MPGFILALSLVAGMDEPPFLRFFASGLLAWLWFWAFQVRHLRQVNIYLEERHD